MHGYTNEYWPLARRKIDATPGTSRKRENDKMYCVKCYDENFFDVNMFGRRAAIDLFRLPVDPARRLSRTRARQ